MRLFIYIFLVLNFYCFGLSSLAQSDVDKKIDQYNTANLDQKIKLFHYFFAKIETDSLLYFVKDIQKEAFKNHNDEAMAMANLGMGSFLQFKSLFKESSDKLEHALKYYIKVGNDTMIADAYNMMGNTAFLAGNTTKAELLYHKSAKYAKKSGDKRYEMLSVPNLAKIYIQQGKYKRAEKDILSYIDFFKKENGKLRLLASAYGLLGQLHLEKKEYEKAINDYNNSMEYGLMVGSMQTVANGYTNLGIVEFLNDNIERSEQYFRLALAYRLKGKNKYYIAEGYYNLGDFYSGIDYNDSAIVNYQKSAEVAKSANNLKTQIDAMAQLSNVYAYLNKKDKQIEVLKNIIALQDDVNKQQNDDILDALGLSYNQSIEELKNVGEEREGELQSQLLKYQSIFNNWLLVAILSIIGLLVLIFFLRRKNRMANRG